MRCNRCKQPMTGLTPYNGACHCGGFIEADEEDRRVADLYLRANPEILARFGLTLPNDSTA